MTNQSKEAGYLVAVESNQSAVIEPIELGQEGVAYIRSGLEQDKVIGCLVENFFDIQRTCFAPLQEGTPIESAKQFKFGFSMPTVAIRKWLASYIVSRWGVDAQLIFADPWLKVGDLERRPQNKSFFSIAGVPYRFPQDGDIYSRLTDGAKEVVTWSFVIYVVAPSVPVPQSGAIMTQDYAKMIARNTQALLVSAYDREGYVVWERGIGK